MQPVFHVCLDCLTDYATRLPLCTAPTSWVGHGDGVHVYNPFTRRLLGKVILPGGKGVANFCWAGRAGKDAITGKDMYRMLLFAEDELWEACVAVNGCD